MFSIFYDEVSHLALMNPIFTCDAHIRMTVIYINEGRLHPHRKYPTPSPLSAGQHDASQSIMVMVFGELSVNQGLERAPPSCKWVTTKF